MPRSKAFELAYPNIYLTCEFGGGGVKGPLRLIQNSKISWHRGTHRITRRSPSENSMLVSQKPESSNQTHCNEHSQVKACGQRDILWDTLGHTAASTMRCFLCFVLFIFNLSLCFLFGRRLQGWRAEMRRWGDECMMGNSQGINQKFKK